MLLKILRAKIHKATVTEANLNYVGSITIDGELLEQADILPGEMVHIVNNNNGQRLETYVIEGEKDSWCHMFKWCCCTSCTAWRYYYNYELWSSE